MSGHPHCSHAVSGQNGCSSARPWPRKSQPHALAWPRWWARTGLSPATGRPAPLDRYLRLARAHRGWLVVDDTQALGILGAQPTPAAPYGFGGGGTPAWHGLQAPELIVVASLAKGFGVPLAVLAGSRGLVETFESRGACRVHCSPPSAAHLAAAAHALALNRRDGDQRRHRLAHGVQRFRRRLQAAGLGVSGGLFPVQTPALGPAAASVHARFLACGIRAVLHRPSQDRPARASFLITATHQAWEIDRAAATLVQIAGTQNARNSMRLRDDGQAAELHA